jgi:hypothetical protein
MPISDYANAFFFAHRKRVTLRGVERGGEVAIIYFRSVRDHQATSIGRGHRELLKPPSDVGPKNPLRRNFGVARCNTGTKRKARHCWAFLPMSFLISSFRQLGDLMR